MLDVLCSELEARTPIQLRNVTPKITTAIEQSFVKYACRSCTANATFDHIARANRGMDLKEFARFCYDFLLIPSVLSQAEMCQLYSSEVGHAPAKYTEQV